MPEYSFRWLKSFSVFSRTEILRDKLQLPDATVLPQPETVSVDNYLSILPPLVIFDFYNYF